MKGKTRQLTESAKRWIQSDCPFHVGQIWISTPPDRQGTELRHQADVGRPTDELELYEDAEQAVELALYDDAGAYRPLKTAPNLRRGWRMVLLEDRAVRLALDLFYPGRLGAWQLFLEGRLRTTTLRETLNRQTGMYRVTGKITDEQADALVGRFCRSDGGCLRTILWKRDAAGTPSSRQLPPEKFDPTADQTGEQVAGKVPVFVPLLCQEACNLLVAEARVVVKGKRE